MGIERDRTVSLRLPGSLVDEFDRVAKAKGRTRTEAVEIAMRRIIAGEHVVVQRPNPTRVVNNHGRDVTPRLKK